MEAAAQKMDTADLKGGLGSAGPLISPDMAADRVESEGGE